MTHELQAIVELKIRKLQRHEIQDLWSIDRTEVIENVYSLAGSELVLKPEHHDVTGWPVGEPEHHGPALLDCFDRGGSFYGAFDGSDLVGAVALEGRFIGSRKDRLQLMFLYVSRAHRHCGLGRALFNRAVTRAKERGARWLYISATPSENTVRFYLHRGCRVADEIDEDLFELEPEDIHLEFEIAT